MHTYSKKVLTFKAEQKVCKFVQLSTATNFIVKNIFETGILAKKQQQRNNWGLAAKYSGSQTCLPCGTLGRLYRYLAGPLDAKIGLKINESDNWRHA